MDEVPLYTNQIIKKNFVLEVWSSSNGNPVLEDDVNIITSVSHRAV
jgi:hypothetical protein